MQEEEKVQNNGHNYVEIMVNDNLYKIHRGNQSISEVKTAGNVPLADKLDQVVNGKLIPLDDNGSIVIKGGEEFKSHVQSGGASC